jgi:hypothetical protein
LLSLPCTPDNLHVLVLGIFEPINGTWMSFLILKLKIGVWHGGLHCSWVFGITSSSFTSQFGL